jgi:hypothetical protein
MSRGIWIFAYDRVAANLQKLAMNELLSCIFYTCIFLSKDMNMYLIRAHILRWWDQPTALLTVLDHRVVVTYSCHRPWRRRRHLWPLKPKCCARSYRRSSR